MNAPQNASLVLSGSTQKGDLIYHPFHETWVVIPSAIEAYDARLFVAIARPDPQIVIVSFLNQKTLELIEPLLVQFSKPIYRRQNLASLELVVPAGTPQREVETLRNLSRMALQMISTYRPLVEAARKFVFNRGTLIDPNFVEILEKLP